MTRQQIIDLIINTKRTDPETGSFVEYLADFLIGYGVTLAPTREQVERIPLPELPEKKEDQK